MKTPEPASDADWRFTSTSEAQTEALASSLADTLEPGTVVALVGNLGAGKTRFVRAICAALGVDLRGVASPTFVLVHEYEGRLPVYHFDTYRLRQASEFLGLGADEYLNSDGVCLIEWANRVEGLLPTDHLRVEIIATGETSRDFYFVANGPKSQRLVELLKASREC